jgi:hypothetical protein
MDDMDFDYEVSIEVYVPGGHNLHLKVSDVTVSRLSRVFKVIRTS